jgi:hypothetical protein
LPSTCKALGSIPSPAKKKKIIILNVITKNIELLEENKGVNLYSIGLDNSFLAMTQQQKKKQENSTLTKLKTFVL